MHGDKRTPAIEAVFDTVVATGAEVPALWHLEVANALTMAVRRKRVSARFQDEVLADLGELDITVDIETARHAWHATRRLAQTHGLTVYDAACLELAQRRRLPLATLDTELAGAARQAGIEVLP